MPGDECELEAGEVGRHRRQIVSRDQRMAEGRGRHERRFVEQREGVEVAGGREGLEAAHRRVERVEGAVRGRADHREGTQVFDRALEGRRAGGVTRERDRLRPGRHDRADHLGAGAGLLSGAAVISVFERLGPRSADAELRRSLYVPAMPPPGWRRSTP